MAHLKDGLFFKRLLTSFTALIFLLLLTQDCAGQSHLVGSPQPIVATPGDDIVLPCHLEPSVDASDMTVEWSRPDLDPRFVYVWRDGVELKSKQHPSYKGRTSLPTDNLKLGNISLTLSRVKISDEGKYRCFVPMTGRESTVELVVAVVGVAPSVVFSSERTDSSELVLQCEAKGWHPEPELFWLDGEGNLLSAGPTKTVRGPDDLYTVSRRLTVRKSDSFTCRVQQKNIKQTRETHFYVPDYFFSPPCTCYTYIIIISLLVVSIVVVLAGFFVWRRKINKVEDQRDELRSQLEELKRQWTAKKYDMVSKYNTDEQEAKRELQQKIKELEENLKEKEAEIKTLKRLKRSHSQRTDENTEMLPVHTVT